MNDGSVRLSRMGTAADESATLRQAARVAELRAAGQRVFNLTVGEPDCDAPAAVGAAACTAIAAGDTHYTPSAGTRALRAGVAAHYSARHGLKWDLEQTIVSTGSKQVLWGALASIVEPGDEVVLMSPYWVSYAADVRLLGGVPRIVRARPENGFKATGDELRAALGSKTRAVIFNSPVNPTGVVYDRADLQDLFAPLLDHPAMVISDEIYERLVFEGEHVSPLQVYPQLRPRFLLATGASKTYAMTGWRIGFGLGPQELIGAMIRLQSHQTGNPNSIAQRAAQAALELPDAVVDEMRQRFRRRRDICVEILSQVPGLEFPAPRGGFYVFLNVEPFFGTWNGGTRIENSEQLATHLLEKHGVAVVAGRAFDHDGGIRLSYTVADAELRQACVLLAGVLRDRR